MKLRGKVARPGADAAVRFQVRDTGVTWQYFHSTRGSSARFEQILHAALFSAPASGDHHLHPHGQLAARLICLDGLRPDALPLLAISGSVPYRCGENVMLEWSEGSVATVAGAARVARVARVERRILSPFTFALWHKATMPAQAPSQDSLDSSRRDHSLEVKGQTIPDASSDSSSVHVSLHDLGPALQDWLKFHRFYPDTSDVLERLACDQMAWWSQHLPGPLFAHCAGYFPLSAVDRSTWARQQKRRMLVVRPPVESSDADDQIAEPQEDSQTAQLLEHLDTAQGVGFDRSELAAALEVLKKEHSSGIAGRTKRQWIDGLQRLQLGSKGVNPNTVILVGWISHMCERGTIDKANPAVSTLRKYASLLLLRLGERLAHFEAEPEDWDARKLLQIYREVMQQTSKGTKVAAHSAILSFQNYLVEIFDTEQLHESVWEAGSLVTGNEGSGQSQQGLQANAQSYESRVIAHVVWPHEVEWCVNACDGVPDIRLGAIAKVKLAIARECAVRYQDLSRLVVTNLSFLRDSRGPYCQIEVVRKAARGSLKTETSQRHLYVRHPENLAVIRAWLALRKEETPSGKAYLFGERNADKVRYRPAAVQALLSRLLKRATGCSGMRFYDLRHSVISDAVADVLMSRAEVDVNLMETVSSAAGHASPYATLRNYSHLYEQPLRLNLDIALTGGIGATSHEMAASLNGLGEKSFAMKPNTLVQIARRWGWELPMLWRTLAHEASQDMPCETVCAPFEWSAPSSLTSWTRTSTDLPVHMLADAIARKADGKEIDAVARIAGLPLPLAIKLFELLEDWLFGLYRRQFPRKTLRQVERPNFQKLLKEMHIKPEQTTHQIWKKLSLHLQTKAAWEQMRGSLDYWERAAPGIHLSLSAAAKPRALIGLLKCGGLGREQQRVVIQSAKDVPGAPCPEVQTEMFDLFQQELGVKPAIEHAPWRVDRPMAYLRINPHEDAIRTGASSDATPALRAWMLAFKARLILADLE